MLKLLNHIKTPLVLINKELLIININKEFTNIFGYKEKDIINLKKITDLLKLENRNNFYAFINNISSSNNKFKLFDKFNNLKTITISADFFYELNKYVLTINDISSFTKETMKLKKTLSEINAIVSAFPDCFLKLNLDGEIIDYNSDVKCEFVKDSKLIIGKKIQDIFNQENNKISDIIHEVFINKKKIKDKFTLTSTKGKQIYEISLIPFFENKIMAIVRNVTERLRFESIAETVVTMNNIGYIFSGIRHEIGNPINNIKMNLSIIKEDYNNYTKDEILNLNNNSIEEISRIEYLLWAIKNFSIYEKLEFREINIINFFNNFLSWAVKNNTIKGIPVITKFAVNTAYVNIDQRALHQVILNLISNAADALKDIENPTITISLFKNNNYIILSIKDNGIGISNTEISKIFNPFYTTKNKGTGLGLVITKRMLIQMNCTIDITSIENKYTEALIYIPLVLNKIFIK